MPVPSLISDLSQTAGSNYPSGGESPITADNYFQAYASFIALLRDGKGFTTQATLASATTTDIGGQNSPFVSVTGTTTITGFGTNYNGPRFVSFTGALTLTHSATLVIPGAANITTASGDACIVVPISGGWKIVAYQRISGLPVVSQNFNVQDYGAVGDGTTNDTAAIQAAITACGAAGGGQVFFPSGTYRCNTNLTVTSNYVELVGAGKYGSIIAFYSTSGSGLTFSGTSLALCGLRNIGLSANAATTGQLLETSGVFRFTAHNAFFNGAPGGTNLAAGLVLLNGTSVYMNGCDGVGATTFGIKALNGNDYFLEGGTFQMNGVVGRALWVENVGGGALQITDMNFLEGANCYLNTVDFASIKGCYFDSAQGAVVVTGCEHVYFAAGCEFANRVTSGSGDGGGIIFGNSKSCGVYDSMVINNGVDGITLGADTTNISIIGNNIDGNNVTNTAGVVAGVNVAGGAQSFKIIGNTIGNNTTLFTGHQKYGVAVGVGASDNYIIADNDVRNNETLSIQDSGTGTAAKLHDNIGYNNATVLPVEVVTAPATTVTYTAGHIPETIYLTGGTVTAVKIPDNAGTTVFTATPCTLNLGPGETFSITHTVAPTMARKRH